MRIGEQECHFQQLACRGWVLAGTRREVIADAAETTVLKVAQLIHKARLQCACRLRRLASCKGVEPSVARLRAGH